MKWPQPCSACLARQLRIEVPRNRSHPNPIRGIQHDNYLHDSTPQIARARLLFISTTAYVVQFAFLAFYENPPEWHGNRDGTEDIPEDPPRLDSCPSYTLAKAQRLPFKTGRTRLAMPLEINHGNLVGPMPVESVSRCKYGFVLIDVDSRAGWVLP